MSKNKKGDFVYLAPEFFTMTGIPDDFNDFQRKKITNTCKKTPK